MQGGWTSGVPPLPMAHRIKTNIRKRTNIRNELRRRIGQEYQPSEQLPSEQQLALEFDVSRNTIREALEELRATGLLLRRWGTGTFVNPNAALIETSLAELSPIPERVRREGRNCEVVDVTRTTEQVPGPVAVHLGIAQDSLVHTLSRVYTVDGVRAVFVEDWIPTEIGGVQLELNLFREDLFAFLSEHGLNLHHAISTIEAIQAPKHVLARLEINGSEPVLSSHQVGFSLSGSPIVYTEAFQRTAVLATRIVRCSRL